MYTYFDLAISFQGIYPTDRVIHVPNDICVRIFMETLFIIMIMDMIGMFISGAMVK